MQPKNWYLCQIFGNSFIAILKSILLSNFLNKLLNIMLMGEKLLNLRKQKGLTQEQLACDLKVSSSTISNYELGLTKPDIEVLCKISEYFHIPIQNLVSDEQYTFFNYENAGGNNGCVNVFYPEKLIEQYELRLREKDEQIAFLKSLLEKK
jgi:transcriptional regulator with XRE-family HTH domain